MNYKLIITLFILLHSTLMAKESKDYTFTLSTTHTDGKLENDGTTYTSTNMITGTLSKKLSDELSGSIIYGSSDVDIDLNNNQGDGDVDVQTYGISLVKKLSLGQYISFSLIKSDTESTTNLKNVPQPTSYTNTSDVLTKNLTFIQWLPINSNIYTILTAGVTHSSTKKDSYTVNGTKTEASKRDLTSYTLGVSPTYIIDNTISAGFDLKYAYANKSFLSGDTYDKNYYTLGLKLRKKLNDSWSLTLSGSQKRGLKTSPSTTYGFALAKKF